MFVSNRKPEQRFWAKVDKDGPLSPLDGTLCWLWTGARSGRTKNNPGGWGTISVNGKPQYAHKFSYALVHGEIEHDVSLRHRETCPKHCVNPDHLSVLLQGFTRRGRKSTPAQERFWPRVDQTGDCWLWAGAVSSNEYGVFRNDDSVQVSAHVFAWESLVGPVQPGNELDHRRTCPKNCVNPAHLRSVPTKGNQENRNGPNQSNVNSRILGVHRHRDGWQVNVKHNGRLHYGGRFRQDQLAEAEAAAIALRNQLFTYNDRDRTTDDDFSLSGDRVTAGSVPAGRPTDAQQAAAV